VVPAWAGARGRAAVACGAWREAGMANLPMPCQFPGWHKPPVHAADRQDTRRVSIFMQKTLSGSIFVMMAISGGLLLHANPVRAQVVTVGGTQYEISSFSGSLYSDASKFAGPPGGQMPWWGDLGLASTFSNAYAQSPAGSNFLNFGYQQTVLDLVIVQISCVLTSQPSCIPDNFATGWATASVYTPPTPSGVPGPVPLLGAAAAFDVSRRLRRRIQGSRSQF
jgi:hypothetical protein